MDTLEKLKRDLASSLEHGQFDKAWIYEVLSDLCKLAYLQGKTAHSIEVIGQLMTEPDNDHSPINGC